MRILLAAAAVILLLAPLPAGARVVRAPLDVWDGDTFTVTLPTPRGGAGPVRLKVRPVGYDAAERGEPCAEGRAMDRAATEALTRLLAEARVVAIVPTGAMSWDRTLARVSVDGRDLADVMVDELGLARRWRRGLPGWCEGRP
jgi:endonuclease YncB( thermonuclease family)